MIEHLYVAHMFPEQTFHVKDLHSIRQRRGALVMLCPLVRVHNARLAARIPAEAGK